MGKSSNFPSLKLMNPHINLVRSSVKLLQKKYYRFKSSQSKICAQEQTTPFGSFCLMDLLRITLSLPTLPPLFKRGYYIISRFSSFTSLHLIKGWRKLSSIFTYAYWVKMQNFLILDSSFWLDHQRLAKTTWRIPFMIFPNQW